MIQKLGVLLCLAIVSAVNANEINISYISADPQTGEMSEIEIPQKKYQKMLQDSTELLSQSTLESLTLSETRRSQQKIKLSNM